jgi:hypothetical protein
MAVRGDEPRVPKRNAKRQAWLEGLIETSERWIGVRQHYIEVAIGELAGTVIKFLLFGPSPDQDVSDTGGDYRRGWPRAIRLYEKRHEFVSEPFLSEWEELDDQCFRPQRVEGAENGPASERACVFEAEPTIVADETTVDCSSDRRQGDQLNSLGRFDEFRELSSAQKDNVEGSSERFAKCKGAGQMS